MFDRAAIALAGAAALCAVAALGVAAAAFAIYALAAPSIGSAGAAALVAAIAAVIVGAFAVGLELRRHQREREAEAARASLMGLIPEDLGAFARERPVISLFVSLLGGAVVARHPSLARDIIALLAAWTRTRS
jgi:hypothetical protein